MDYVKPFETPIEVTPPKLYCYNIYPLTTGYKWARYKSDGINKIEFLDYVYSTNNNAYPNGMYTDGYYYEKISTESNLIPDKTEGLFNDNRIGYTVRTASVPVPTEIYYTTSSEIVYESNMDKLDFFAPAVYYDGASFSFITDTDLWVTRDFSYWTHQEYGGGSFDNSRVCAFGRNTQGTLSGHSSISYSSTAYNNTNSGTRLLVSNTNDYQVDSRRIIFCDGMFYVHIPPYLFRISDSINYTISKYTVSNMYGHITNVWRMPAHIVIAYYNGFPGICIFDLNMNYVATYAGSVKPSYTLEVPLQKYSSSSSLCFFGTIAEQGTRIFQLTIDYATQSVNFQISPCSITQSCEYGFVQNGEQYIVLKYLRGIYRATSLTTWVNDTAVFGNLPQNISDVHPMTSINDDSMGILFRVQYKDTYFVRRIKTTANIQIPHTRILGTEDEMYFKTYTKDSQDIFLNSPPSQVCFVKVPQSEPIPIDKCLIYHFLPGSPLGGYIDSEMRTTWPSYNDNGLFTDGNKIGAVRLFGFNPPIGYK